MDHSSSQSAQALLTQSSHSSGGDQAIPHDQLRAVMGELRAYGGSEEEPNPAWGKGKSGRASKRKKCMRGDLKGEEELAR